MKIYSLSAMTYSNGFTLWHYRTHDPYETVLSPGYFDPAIKMLRKGDFLFINTSDKHFQAVIREIDLSVHISPLVSADA